MKPAFSRQHITQKRMTSLTRRKKIEKASWFYSLRFEKWFSWLTDFECENILRRAVYRNENQFANYVLIKLCKKFSWQDNLIRRDYCHGQKEGILKRSSFPNMRHLCCKLQIPKRLFYCRQLSLLPEDRDGMLAYHNFASVDIWSKSFRGETKRT